MGKDIALVFDLNVRGSSGLFNISGYDESLGCSTRPSYRYTLAAALSINGSAISFQLRSRCFSIIDTVGGVRGGGGVLGGGGVRGCGGGSNGGGGGGGVTGLLIGIGEGGFSTLDETLLYSYSPSSSLLL